jgi:hypothetical protein
MLLGYHGVQDFEACRKRASTMTGDNKLGAFHDGKQVLPEVKIWHERLRSLVRSDNPTTSKILDLIEDHLLQGDPTLRYDTTKLYEYLEEVLQDVDVNKQHADERVDIEATADKLEMNVAATAGASRGDLMPGRGATEILKHYSDGKHRQEDNNELSSARLGGVDSVDHSSVRT